MNARCRSIFAFVVVVVVAGSCASGSGGQSVSTSDLPDIATSMRRQPLRFAFDQRIAGAGIDGFRRLAVRGIVVDDYRYEATVAVDGRPVLEEVDADDARYLRLLDANVLPANTPSDLAVDALRNGQWVGDLRGAPADLTPSTPAAGRYAALLSPQLILQTVRFLEHVDEFLRRASVRTKWNPNAANYLQKNDRFPPHKEDGVRFDFLPAAFDSDRVFRDGIPNNPSELADRYFRSSAVWVKGGRITRVESLVDVPDSFARGVERAAKLQAQRTGQRLADLRASISAATAVVTQQQTWRFAKAAASDHVNVPDAAVRTNFTTLLAALAGPAGPAS